MYLDKNETLVSRDENGNVIPVEVVLELVIDKPSIKITPLLKGELQRIYNSGDNSKITDDEIILNHCIEPKYSEEEIKFLKPSIYGAIVTAIVALSLGITQDNVKEASTKEVVKKAENKQNF